MSVSVRVPIAAAVVLALLLAACGADASRAPSAAPSAAAPTASPMPTPTSGQIVPAPGSSSTVYAPNPAAIVVAIDPGHGGCLDWGVPNPWDNTEAKAEKADTLAIGLALRDLLEAQGVTVVMTRTDDVALAGDDYPDLGCHGPAWRDVDGNGEAGFEQTGRTRTRDELQARLDVANLARADLLLSLHVNSISQNGVAFEIAVTEAFYDDETPWGEAGSGDLGRHIQAGVVAALDAAAPYERQDRGTEAVAYYIVSRQWQDGDSCEVEGDTWCKPHRGAQQPSVLSEVGSMTLEAESELLATEAGRRAVAEGLFEGIRAWIAEREVGVRYDAAVPGGEGGRVPPPVDGSGPPFWAPALPAEVAVSGRLDLTLTNTGQQAWPAGLALLVGWEASDLPYLPDAPAQTAPAGVSAPALAPGESVTLEVPLETPSGGRSLAWFSLADDDGPLTRHGLPALQLAWDG